MMPFAALHCTAHLICADRWFLALGFSLLTETSYAYVFRRVHGVPLPKPVAPPGFHSDAAGAPLAAPKAQPVSAAQRPPPLACSSGNVAKQRPLTPGDAEKPSSPGGAHKRERAEEAGGGPGEAAKKPHVAGKSRGGRARYNGIGFLLRVCFTDASCAFQGRSVCLPVIRLLKGLSLRGRLVHVMAVLQMAPKQPPMAHGQEMRCRIPGPQQCPRPHQQGSRLELQP